MQVLHAATITALVALSGVHVIYAQITRPTPTDVGILAGLPPN